MMLDRDKITFWTRLGAIVLAVIFVGSFVIMGVGSNVNLNLLDLLGGSSGAQEDQQQTTSSREQITQARQELEEDPENPKIIRRLAGLYIQNGQTDEAAEVLERGREVAPDDPVIPLYLGQAYERDAQAQTDAEERQAAYEQAGDAYAAAAELQPEKPQAYLAAGQAYEQAGDKGRAIQYWNDYLELEPDGEQADAVKERIASLLEGEQTTPGAAGPKQK
ncbi:MAG TPA: tetratricopeptide repeat protein [Rubrobacteraceae bacterium]|jgi:tetratricopeptide (TPR) repeat protein|nr:tetratricopeptide repeat protein [Rubrobacteraceae bacterium]